MAEKAATCCWEHGHGDERVALWASSESDKGKCIWGDVWLRMGGDDGAVIRGAEMVPILISRSVPPCHAEDAARGRLLGLAFTDGWIRGIDWQDQDRADGLADEVFDNAG